MSNYNTLKTTIDANIKQNGNQEITGQILNSVLNAMVTTLGTGYQFAGVATIATNPGTPDAKVFYIANGKGTYEKFGGLEVTEDDVVVLYYDTAWHKVSTGIASQAKLSELEEKVANAVSITYAELKSLRDAGKLVPGQQYRITDYTCTTTQANTKSAEHIFDIIVTADDERTLNEIARAAKHYGDTYFANSDLNAWKIWYCLDNDTNRFAWADATNGKGVIYRMIDEWSNDVPYDFKNIQFARDWSVVSPDSGLAGIIYCYTFSIFLEGFSENATASDESVKAKECIESDEVGFFGNNVIRTYQNLGVCFLNGIVFVTDWTSFSVNHYSNTFGNNCYSNTFGNDCYSNTFGNDCNNNTFGNGCYYNTFGNDCNNNTFGNNCSSNTFGNYCGNNTFGNDCAFNTFGNSCQGNTFGDDCYNNTFRNNCYYIKLASDASATTKCNYYQHNHFGDGCQYIVFTGSETASGAQRVQRYNFAQGLQGTRNAYLTIDGKRNLAYETKVAKNSNGEIKTYCEADLIL